MGWKNMSIVTLSTMLNVDGIKGKKSTFQSDITVLPMVSRETTNFWSFLLQNTEMSGTNIIINKLPLFISISCFFFCCLSNFSLSAFSLANFALLIFSSVSLFLMFSFNASFYKEQNRTLYYFYI